MATREQIIAALSGYSIEVTPASANKVESFAAQLPAGTTVNVTFLPGSNIADTIAVAERLAGEGMVAVPHIAARSLESEEHLARYLGGLTFRAGVRQVLLVAGGLDRPLGPYASSLAVLQSGLLERHGIAKVSVAGHPEGSLDIAAPALAAALAAKNEWAAHTGIETYIATQFCFEADPVLAWERHIRAAGNRLPIHIGVPGLATIKTLMKFAQMSGIGPSMRVLRRQARNLARLLRVQAPDRLVAGLAEAMAEDPDCLITNLHFYPFGGLAKTAQWANAALAGDFACLDDGFTVGDPDPLRQAS